MAKKSLYDCRHGKDFAQYAETHGAKEIRPGKGDHVIIKGERGMVVVPVAHELGKGLRSKVIKTMIAIGISATLFFLFLMLSGGGVA